MCIRRECLHGRVQDVSKQSQNSSKIQTPICRNILFSFALDHCKCRLQTEGKMQTADGG